MFRRWFLRLTIRVSDARLRKVVASARQTETGGPVVWRKAGPGQGRYALPFCAACGERVIPAPQGHPFPFLHSKCSGASR